MNKLTRWLIRLLIVVVGLIAVILLVNIKGSGENVIDRVFILGLLVTLFSVAGMVKASKFMGGPVSSATNDKGNVNLHQVTSACEANYSTSKHMDNRAEYLSNGGFIFGKPNAYLVTIGISLIILSCLAYRYEFFFELLITESF
ncbi:hypothetical protein [Vallitalea okinawensis]|uniref:hypothetical protein n=1 Tax=Vallitalea okinawensis TaxID=2078660 RepID=UPI000CFC7BF3|nr:hypothetical protein [Vallitalea okinawensis]